MGAAARQRVARGPHGGDLDRSSAPIRAFVTVRAVPVRVQTATALASGDPLKGGGTLAANSGSNGCGQSLPPGIFRFTRAKGGLDDSPYTQRGSHCVRHCLAAGGLVRAAPGRRRGCQGQPNQWGGPVGGRRSVSPAREVVLVKVEVSGLSGGFHGFHVHKYGSCDPDPLTSAHPDTGKKGVFLSAGGHFNPTGETHKDHAGDMPLLLAMQEGVASARFKTDRLDVSALVDPPRAVIVHADPDNYANIPARYGGPDVATLATGDAGARYACGVIAESE